MDDLDLYDPDELTPMDLDGLDDLDDIDDIDDWDWTSTLGTVLSGASTIGDAAYRGKYSKNVKKHWGEGNWKGKLVDSGIKAAIGAIGSFGKGLISEDADPYEPEFETDTIDEIEGAMADALDGEDGIDASVAADEMVSRSFGPMRSSARLRPIMARLSMEMRRMIMLARHNPRMRNVARLAPLALRRTSVVLMRMLAARRPVSVNTARGIFRAILRRLAQSQRLRVMALRRARMRARRARGGYAGGYRRAQPGSYRSRYRRMAHRTPSRRQYGYGY